MNDRVVQNALTDFANGDSTALSVIYDKIGKLIFSIAYATLRNYQDAEDVLQDTFVRIVENASDFVIKHENGAKAWILTIARNRAIDLMRKRKPSHSLDCPETLSAESTLLSKPDDYSRLEVFDMLNRLDEQQRQVIIYRLYAKMSHKEIAAIMGITAANSQKKYQRAIKKLKEEYLK